jgi:uncharacterized protein (DUF2147 family)
MQSKNLIILSVLFLFSSISKAQNKADDIVGNWLTTGKEPAKIQIYKSGKMFYGKIVWLQNPTDNGKPKVDNNNPDKAKRSNPVIGSVILMGFKFDGNNEWKGGDIYDPESGKTYSSYLFLKDKNTLKVRGYVGISLFGRTETWSRTD